MSARRRHVVGPVVNRDLASSGGSRHYYDGDEASSRLLSEETVDLDPSEQQSTTTTTTMTSRDRTNEFANAIRSMQSRTVARTAANLQNPRRARQIQSYSNFMMIAKNISRNIAGTYIKLEKLALCKNSAEHSLDDYNMLHPSRTLQTIKLTFVVQRRFFFGPYA